MYINDLGKFSNDFFFSFEQIIGGIAWSPLMATHMQVPSASVCHKQGPSWLVTLYK
jgi:hypothetical protein